MKIQYFEQTDTLYIIFSKGTPVETKDLDENTLIDLAQDGHLCSMTIEQAKERGAISEIEYQTITVQYPSNSN